MILAPLSTVSATALRGAARFLRLAAEASQTIAELLDSRGAATPTPPRPRTEPARPPRPEAAPDVAGVDVAALTSRPAREVIDAIEALSMDQLAELHAHESRRRRRRTVLEAIDRAATPPDDARDIDEVRTDVRQPDEVVYTTQTPAR